MKHSFKHIPKKAGVYQCFTPSGAYYIGRAVDMRARITAHMSYMKRGKHDNIRMQRSYEKYGNKLKWSVLFIADTVETAIEWELRYIQMFWGDDKLMNMREGDAFTIEENERNKRVPVYAMNKITGGYIKLSHKGEFGKMFARHRSSRIPNAIYGRTLNECRDKRVEFIKAEIKTMSNNLMQAAITQEFQRRKAAKRMMRYGFICRNINTGEHRLVKQSDKPNCSGYMDGWEKRRVHEEWPLIGTHPKAVFGYHPVKGKMIWNSMGACARSLNRSQSGVVKAIDKRQRTCAGWTLTRWHR